LEVQGYELPILFDMFTLNKNVKRILGKLHRSILKMVSMSIFLTDAS